MIKTTTELNAEALSAVRAIHLASPGNVKKRHLVRNVAVIVAVVMVLFAAVYVPQQNYATAPSYCNFGAPVCGWDLRGLPHYDHA